MSCSGLFIVAILVSKQRVNRVDFLVGTHPETAQCHSERSEESTVNVEATRFFVTSFLKPVLEQREGMTVESKVSG